MPDDPNETNGDEGGGEEAPAIRPFWSGIITFGLVSVPVNLFAGYRSARPGLRMVSDDGTPLERRYYCPADGEELDRDDIVRGYEIEKDRFVLVRDEELEALEPRKTREIDLQRFVARDRLDPVFFQRAYFLTPSTEATKPYRLLARTMEETGRAGIASFVMRGREYLVAILADRGILRAETMRFHDEIRSLEDVGLADVAPEPEEGSVAQMREMVRVRAADELDSGELEDFWPDRLRELVDRKRERGEGVVEPGEERTEAAPPSEGPEVIDIMEVLKRNLRGEAGDGDGRRPEELREKTKKELYDRARELEIGGRSDMTKDELVRAILEAS